MEIFLNIVEDKRNKNYYIDDPRYEKYKLFIDENRLGIQYDSVRLNFLFLGEFFYLLMKLLLLLKTSILTRINWFYTLKSKNCM